LATFTLRDLITSPKPTFTVGDLTISAFRNLGSTVSASQIIIETIDGPTPGLTITTASPLSSSTTAQNIGFEFRATAASAIIEGASVTLNGVSFSSNDAGGSVDVVIGQAGRDDDNIDFTAFIDNGAGEPDDPDAAGTITGGPVNTFRFDFDMFLTPANGVTATYGSTTFLFDLVGDEPPPPTLPPGFDGLQYIASHTDLIAALGANRAAGEQHYLNFGQGEGRQVDTFSETEYLRSHADLQAAFGTNVVLATQHFITNGHGEGRDDDAASPSQIQGLQYIASHADLIAALGANAAVGQQHYASFGQGEGRALDTFDETQYLANYVDLQAAFGSDTEAATQHYIQFGFNEGRNDFIV
jgi:hypothetical protein